MESNFSVKVEFELKEISNENVKKLNEKLSNLEGIKNYTLDVNNQRLNIETWLPLSCLHQILEEITNSEVSLTGMGNMTDAAVVQLVNYSDIKGLIRLIQINENVCVIDGIIHGLDNGCYELVIFENGDLTHAFESLGSRFNSTQINNGKIGIINADQDKKSIFRWVIKNFDISDLVGRSICICNLTKKLSCGIIARSSKIFDNFKRICLCNGKTIWSEKQNF
ncbi:unnamed protein product [Brachionus calyciflorus]|uniref:Superoxide dismutase n=1 Tax=Brachionus calyciflorus TaxID=104777 RepID=A0A814ABS2_9BILA|nr:unnamed protein product [Brachionus calyciflorus]